MRALDAACESPSSVSSARTVVQLGKLPLAERKKYLMKTIDWDLGHLVRCCLQELSPDTRIALQGGNETALCAAARGGKVRSLKALLNGCANHALTDSIGWTPLYISAEGGHLACLQFLIEAGADARVEDRLGATPSIAAAMSDHVECVRALLPPVSDFHHTTRAGVTVFHCCVSAVSEKCFELLLPLMEDVDVRTVPGLNSAGSPRQIFHSTVLHSAQPHRALWHASSSLWGGPKSHCLPLRRFLDWIRMALQHSTMLLRSATRRSAACSLRWVRSWMVRTRMATHRWSMLSKNIPIKHRCTSCCPAAAPPTRPALSATTAASRRGGACSLAAPATWCATATLLASWPDGMRTRRNAM
jgi:Ankyrin repeats (3 copies)